MNFSSIDWYHLSNFAVGIILLPFSVATIKHLIENHNALFDEELTKKDRALLKQIAVFVVIPLVVLFHELGHAIFCRIYNVQITSFHWALFWGEVSWRGVISPEGPAIIAAAGNVFQAGTALLALIVALVASAPAIVALASYSYLWIAFSCLIFYPLVSLAAWNYDFAILYGSPDKRVVWTAACIHLLLAWGFIYSFLSNRTRLIFALKTRPIWAKEFAKVKQKAEEENTAVAYLALAWQYYLVGLDGMAEKTLQTVHKIEPGNLDVWLLRGYIMQSQSKFETADFCFENIVKGKSDATLKARAYMAKGHCIYQKIAEDKNKDMSPVLMSYKKAVESASDLADPHYYLAVVLKESGQMLAAENELKICLNAQNQGLNWLDPVLANLARQEMGSLRNTSKEK